MCSLPVSHPTTRRLGATLGKSPSSTHYKLNLKLTSFKHFVGILHIQRRRGARFVLAYPHAQAQKG
jgi:hypothetical protein